MAEQKIMYLAGTGFTWDQDQADTDQYGKPIICPGALSTIMLRNRRVIDQVGELLLDALEKVWDSEEEGDESHNGDVIRFDTLAEAFAILIHPVQYKESPAKATERMKEWANAQFPA